MNRYKILRHPEMEPCTSEQALVREIRAMVLKAARESVKPTLGSHSTLSSIPGIKNIRHDPVTGTINFTYNQEEWTITF